MPVTATVEGDTTCSSSSGEEEEEGEEVERDGSDSDTDAVAGSVEGCRTEVKRGPPPRRRGLHVCSLCPERLLLSDADLEKHMASKSHAKREKRAKAGSVEWRTWVR